MGITTFQVDDAGTGRKFSVEAWYPAAPVGGERVETYVADLRPLVGQIAIPSPAGAVRDAPPAAAALPAPVVLFSHGLGALRTVSFFLAEHLASHGYVFLAPDHGANTIFDIATADPITAAAMPLLRPLDLSLALDEAIALSERGDPVLGGAVDSRRVGVAGHSYGGYVALALGGGLLDVGRARAACAEEGEISISNCRFVDELEGDWHSVRDERVLAVVALAPVLLDYFNRESVSYVTVPVLVEAAARDGTAPYYDHAKVVYDALRPPRFLLRLRNAGHLAFTNVCAAAAAVGAERLRMLAGPVIDDGCGRDYLPAEEGHTAAAAFATAFFDRYLRGDVAAARYLEASYAERFPAASLQADTR